MDTSINKRVAAIAKVAEIGGGAWSAVLPMVATTTTNERLPVASKK